MFDPVPPQADFPRQEEAILEFWKSRGVYEQSLDRRRGGPAFVFYEGPPTANGMPHPGHCLTRAIKDLFPRYRTMRGYFCERKAGWDTHGLPVEVEVCKELGIHSKEEIEQFGVEPFIQKCQQSVWRYMRQWEQLTERLGFWVNLEEAYVTYHQSYVESVWWCLKNLFDRGLLYQGHKIVWWWAQGGTALSSGEVGQGYREVADPSVYVRFPLLPGQGHPEGTALVVWTTTPWTLPSNQFAAVHPELEYVRVVDAETNERFLVARALVDEVAAKAKRTWDTEDLFSGRELLGLRYLPPFDYYHAALGDALGPLRAGGEQHLAWRVVAADFVTTESGTGVVHQAPAFGEVDFDVLLAEAARFEPERGPELLCAVGPDGKFTAEAPEYEGRWVKDCDRDIIRALKERGLLVHQEQYLHEYPFCWRAENDPLIQYPRRSWFVRTTAFKDRMLANNSGIRWLPEHIRDGRFGNFLESNVDWALSRERYWGTPLPIWVCQETGRMEAIGSYEELLGKPGLAGAESWEAAKREHPDLPEDLRVHKPYIDDLTYDSPFAPGGRMRRVSEVIDCWFDSGAMPFAQWGYRGPEGPAGAAESFESQFPADFISEALDQTRGWFYSLLAISTLLFGEEQGRGGAAKHAPLNDPTETTPPGLMSVIAASAALAPQSHDFPHPFRNCIVLGLMLAESYVCQKCGKRSLVEAPACEACGGHVSRKIEKMSKSLRNYREPNEIFDRYGADALRWYLFANQAPWNSIIYSERAIKESIPEFLLRLWNVYSFFIIYANIDGFDPASRLTGEVDELSPETLARAEGYRPAAARGELDRWILSELHRTAAGVVERMDAYESFPATGLLNEFVDALSNWYVRRSRSRFWSGATDSPEKLDAYFTLYECLLATSKLIAPFTPFLAETLWRNLTGPFAGRVRESVHLCDYPVGEAAAVDLPLSRRMRRLREIASLGRSARTEAGLKVRQPLAGMEVVLSETEDQAWLEAHDALLREELNVKRIEYTTDGRDYIEYQVQPNFKRLGPKLGRLLPTAKKTLTAADGGALLAELKESGKIVLELEGSAVELDEEDIQIRMQARAGWAAARGPTCVVVLSTELTPELVREGYAKDLIRLVQDVRKSRNYEYTDRIAIGVEAADPEIHAALVAFAPMICEETLAEKLQPAPLSGAEGLAQEIAGLAVTLYVERVGPTR